MKTYQRVGLTLFISGICSWYMGNPDVKYVGLVVQIIGQILFIHGGDS